MELDENPFIVRLALEWLYTAKYTCDSRKKITIDIIRLPENNKENEIPRDSNTVKSITTNKETESSTSIDPLIVHAKVYALAKKWRLEELQFEASSRYGSTVMIEGCCDAFTSSLRAICAPPKKSFEEDKIASIALGYAAVKFNEFLNQKSFCDFLTERGDVAVAIGKLRAKLVGNAPTSLQPLGPLSMPDCAKCNDNSNVRIPSRNEKSSLGTVAIFFCTKCQHSF